MIVVRSFCRLLVLAAVILPACAKRPSAIDVNITADDTVPIVTLLRSTVARASDPSTPATLKWVSAGGADPDAGAGGFPFPLLLHVSIDPGWSGPVTLTVDGLAFLTEAVIATGTTDATVVSEQTTTASLSLTGVAVGGGGGDGGAGDSGTDGGAPPDDAASPDAAD